MYKTFCIDGTLPDLIHIVSSENTVKYQFEKILFKSFLNTESNYINSIENLLHFNNQINNDKLYLLDWQPFKKVFEFLSDSNNYKQEILQLCTICHNLNYFKKCQMLIVTFVENDLKKWHKILKQKKLNISFKCLKNLNYIYTIFASYFQWPILQISASEDVSIKINLALKKILFQFEESENIVFCRGPIIEEKNVLMVYYSSINYLPWSSIEKFLQKNWTLLIICNANEDMQTVQTNCCNKICPMTIIILDNEKSFKDIINLKFYQNNCKNRNIIFYTPFENVKIDNWICVNDLSNTIKALENINKLY